MQNINQFKEEGSIYIMVIHKPQSKKIEGVKVRGIIRDSEKDWFTFDFEPKNKDFKKKLKELRPGVQKIKNERYNYFRPPPPMTGSLVHLIYLNEESARGLYKDPENNLPYEILDIYGSSVIYRQSRIERKEDILNGLEKAAIEEGLRNK